jgi:hypothetical protein
MVRRARSRLIGHPVCSAPVWGRAERMDLSEAATWPLWLANARICELSALSARMLARSIA